MEREKKSTKCPLCNSLPLKEVQNHYWLCSTCKGIFKHPDYHLSAKEEKAHYKTHNNDVFDKGYRKFVSPITSQIIKRFTPQHLGLDYGAGTGPVITKVLEEKGYKVALYDPFFHPNTEVLNHPYDYIACCEVAEHFHQPLKEFERLKSLLKPKGQLLMMTHLYNPNISFAHWYYKNDPTHVFIYQKETILWLKEKLVFDETKINDRLITFVAR